MNIDIDKLRHPGKHTIWTFSEEEDMALLSQKVSAIAQTLRFHFAFMDGTTIREKDQLLKTVAKLYDFPYDFSVEQYTWDGAKDWLGDLTWFTGFPPNETGVAGFILLYSNVKPLFCSSPVDLAHFLDIVSDSADALHEDNIPFNLILGAVDPQIHSFIQTLKASERLGW